MVSVFLTGKASNEKKECSYGGYLYATKACTEGRAPGLSPGPPVVMGTGQRRSNFRTFGIRSGICSPNMCVFPGKGFFSVVFIK